MKSKGGKKVNQYNEQEEAKKRTSKRCHEIDQVSKQDAIAKSYCKKEIDPDQLLKEHIDDKIGYGVFAKKTFFPGDFLLEYPGEMLSLEEAEKREEIYEELKKGCFMYYLEIRKKLIGFDATHSVRLGKYVNDSSPTYANAKMRSIDVEGRPHLCLFAGTSGIPVGTEIRYDYGRTSGLFWRSWGKYRRPFFLPSLDSERIDHPNAVPGRALKPSKVLNLLSNGKVNENVNIGAEKDEGEVCFELSERAYEQNSVALIDLDPSQEESKVNSVKKDQGTCDKDDTVVLSEDVDDSMKVPDSWDTLLVHSDKHGEREHQKNDIENSQCDDETDTALFDEESIKSLEGIAKEATGQSVKEFMESSISKIRKAEDSMFYFAEEVSTKNNITNDSNTLFGKELKNVVIETEKSEITKINNVEENVGSFASAENILTQSNVVNGSNTLFGKELKNDTIETKKNEITKMNSFEKDQVTCTSVFGDDTVVLSSGDIDSNVNVQDPWDILLDHSKSGTKGEQQEVNNISNSRFDSDTNDLLLETGTTKFGEKLEENDDISKLKNCLITAVNQNDFDSCRMILDDIQSIEKGASLRKVKCVIQGCSKYVVDIPRHLRGPMHNVPKEKAAKAKLIFGIRKPYTWKDKSKRNCDNDLKKKSDRHKVRRCPMEDCYTVSPRIDLHLRRLHGFRLGSQRYKFALWETKNLKRCQVTEDNPISFDTEILEINNSSCGNEVEIEKIQPEKKIKISSINQESNQIKQVPSDIREMLKKFQNYLESHDGGKRETLSAKQSSSEVERICISLSSPSLINLCSPLYVRECFFDRVCVEKKYKAETIKHYIRSLSDFYNFILTEEIEVGIPFENLIKGRSRCAKWLRSYNKAAKERFLERSMEDSEMLLTPDQVDVYRESHVARSNTLHFASFQNRNSNTILTPKIYCSMRDYLFVELALTNACRPGSIVNMLMSEYEKVKFEEDGTAVIYVKKHKTASTHGHIGVFFKPIVYQYLCIYINSVRPKVLQGVDSSYVFLTYSGQQMQPETVSKQINKRFIDAEIYGDGMLPPRNMTLSRIRKSATTGTRKSGLRHEKEVAVLMAHDVSTSNKHYDLAARQASAMKGSQIISSYFDGASSGTKTKQEWLDEQVEQLRKIFKACISERKLNMSDVRDLRMMLDSSFDNILDKQIFDKIRGFWRYPGTKSAHEPPNAEESLNCKIQCLESNENMPVNESTESEYKSDTSEISGSSETSAHISNSTERNSLFSEKDKKIIKCLCAKLILVGK